MSKTRNSNNDSKSKFVDMAATLNEMGNDHEDHDEYDKSQEAYGLASLLDDIGNGYIARDDD